MRSLSPATRLALGLATMTVTVLCAAQAAGVIRDPRVDEQKHRVEFSSVAAVAISDKLDDAALQSALRRGDRPTGLQMLLSGLMSQNAAVRSAAVVAADGRTIASVGPHRALWQPDVDDRTQVFVPIYDREVDFGRVELKFKPLVSQQFGFSIPPLVRTFAFIAAAGFITHLLFLRRMLRYLDPSRAVPERVRTTLDTLAEGLVLLDRDANVVLVNSSLTNILGVPDKMLTGRDISTLPWCRDDVAIPAEKLPWNEAIAANEAIVGTTLQLRVSEDGIASLLQGNVAEPYTPDAFGFDVSGWRTVSFLVNATPITSETDDDDRGALVSFDDITNLEQKKIQLAETLEAVRESSAEIQRQNEELERLATHDALTGCVNRRRLFGDLESLWNAADRHDLPLSVLLLDVDHFKDVNDTHGHGVGDDVLAAVGETLRVIARDSDLVARYGGEEFCVVLPHTNVDEATIAADRFRAAIADREVDGIRVTASFGVSSRGYQSKDPQALIDQADRCLYEAKHAGRDCVRNVKEIDLSTPMPKHDASVIETTDSVATGIPFHAVTALISALAYRDPSTASHSRRVADLAVATAEGLLTLSDCYTLEIAALLHDLGKIGVPDHILLKADKLTDEEWAVMRCQDEIGVEIVRASFACPALTTILRQSRTRFADAGQSLPARILAVADAYDAIVTDKPYRSGRSRAEAFAELRRCSEDAVGQFDPEIVERFISSVRANRSGPALSVTKETALSIGMQIEHLAAALDDQDLDRLAAMAQRVQKVAVQFGVEPVASQASLLSQAVGDSDRDLLSVLQSAGDLLSLCRSTQTTYIDAAGSPVADVEDEERSVLAMSR